MSEMTFYHYRTAPLRFQTVQGGTLERSPGSVEDTDLLSHPDAYWSREGNVVHLFLPQMRGQVADGDTLQIGPLPSWLWPSLPLTATLPVRAGETASEGTIEMPQGATMLTLAPGVAGEITLGPVAIHYLAIPGHRADRQGIMRALTVPALLTTAQYAREVAYGPQDEDAGEDARGDAGVPGGDPAEQFRPSGEASEAGSGYSPLRVETSEPANTPPVAEEETHQSS